MSATKEIEPSSPEVDTKSEKTSKKRKTEIDEIAVDLTLPEPPSKKAKRLLKKGKSLPKKPKSDDDDSDDEESKDVTKKKEKKERSPYGIWIGNLRFTVTKPELRQWFVDNSGGAITDDLITRVHLPTSKNAGPAGPGPKKPTENRGFAYVDFATYEANVAAIALSETEWYRRKVLIKDAKSFDGRPKKEEPAPVDNTNGAAAGTEKTGHSNARNTSASTSTKIFVGNLSFAVTEDDLREHFAKCGPIRWIKVATFEDTGKCKGYGWVNFEEPEAAQWAVKGFVKVRETVDTLEDFMDVDEKEEETKEETKEEEEKEESSSSDSDSGSEADSESDSESDKKKKKAEAAAAKAKAAKAKQTQKEAPRIKTRKWWVNQLHGRTLKIELAEDDQTRYQKRFKGKGGAARRAAQEGGAGGVAITEVDGGKPQGEKREYIKKPAPSYSTDINVARLTGAAVAPQGKKTTF
ncbi:putative RNA-binding protein [Podospora australis]|uniref:RNA-binding protein n=1 Tax=Podospora australis TaxID=1536484 RepID=A0AAN6X191_9PEZI|nr:putative RNA-binding protein [Podospora australis]